MLAIASMMLLTAVYSGVEKAQQRDIQLTYERDQRSLSSLMAVQFDNIRLLSQEITHYHELHQSLNANDSVRIAAILDALLADSSGRYIDALVVEDKEGLSTVASNVGLLGVQLPLEKIAEHDKGSFAVWRSITLEKGDKHYSLLHLALPVIDQQLGEVIGKLHTLVLLNNNYWLLNQLQEMFGSQAISLHSGDIVLDSQQSQAGKLQALRSATQATHNAISMTENGTVRIHHLRIGNSAEYQIRSLLPNDAQQLLQQAYTTNLYYASALVSVLAITVMLVLRQLIHGALQQLTRYAEQVPQCGSPEPFKGGCFHEFIRVGKAVEKMLLRIRERDKQLSSIIDNSPNLIFIRDLQHNFRLVNKRCAEVLGTTAERLLTSDNQGGISAAVQAALRKEDQHLGDYLRPVQYEMEITTANGPRTFLVSKFPLLDEQNKLDSIGSIATDVTAIKHAQEQVQLAQQVFAETAEAIIILDGQHNLLSSNQAFIEMSGCSRDDAETVIHSFLSMHANIMQHLQQAQRWQGEGTLQCRSGSMLPVLVSVTSLPGDADKKLYVLLFSDITKLKIAEQKMEQLALYDSLTGLPNRSLFTQRLNDVLSSDSLLTSALMFLDLDHFKSINDSYGHSVGDQLLRQVADRLRTCIQARDTVARFGGDEFVIILREVCNREQIKKIALRILAALNKPYQLGSRQCFTSASIGIALLAEDGDNIDTLTRHADQAMYQAKQRGRDNLQFFNAKINAREQRLYQHEKDLHKALSNNELFIHYQPRFDIEGQQVLGAEALVRWRHPKQGLIPPGEFIPVAEGSKLIIEIGRFVLFAACYQAAQWHADGYPIPISVNLSPRQLYAHDLLQDIHAALNYSGLPAHLLELEITETSLMENINQALPILEQIRVLGVKLSIDDFGTGYSSLMYLKKLPVSILKIDRAFIMDLPGDADGENLVRAIICMAHSLHLRVVAEGVETEQQQQFLRDQGCDELQGGLLGRPGSAEQLKALADLGRTNSDSIDALDCQLTPFPY